MVSKIIFNRNDLVVEEISFDSSKEPCDSEEKLSSSGLVEICAVSDGSGFHRVLNRDIPCSVGDLFVVNADIEHGYFVAENGGAMTVQKILFSKDGMFFNSGEALEDCYGVFKENSVMAYAMLNTDTESEIDGLWEGIKRELEEKQDCWEHNAYTSFQEITRFLLLSALLLPHPQCSHKE